MPFNWKEDILIQQCYRRSINSNNVIEINIFLIYLKIVYFIYFLKKKEYQNQICISLNIDMSQ